MENGIEIVDRSVMEENKPLNDGVSPGKEGERVMAGSEITRDMEGEVFEEAIGGQEHFNDQGAEPALVDETVASHGDENESAKTTSAIDPGKVEGTDSNAALDEEPFEEAMGIPVDDGNQEEVATPVTARGDGMLSLFLPDKTDDGGTGNRGKEVTDAVFNEETEVSQEGGVEEHMKSVAVIVNPGDAEDSEQVFSDGRLEDDDGEKDEQGIVDSDHKIESNPKHSPENCKSEQSDDSIINAGYSYDKYAESVVSSRDEFVELHGENDRQKKLPNLHTESQLEGFRQQKGAVADTDFADVRDEGEKAVNGLASLGSQDRGGEEDVKDASAVHDLTYHGYTDELKDTSSKICTSMEPEASPEFRSFSSSKESTFKMNEKFPVSKPDTTNNNHQNTNDKVTHVGEENAVVQEPEQKEQEDQNRGVSEDGEVKPAKCPSSAKNEESTKENCSTQVNNGSQTRTSPMVVISAKSTNSATSSARPAGLGRAAPLLEPAHRVVQQPRANGTASHAQSQQIDYSPNGEVEEGDETREKLQMIRVKFLRLAHRLGQTPHNVVVAQVLYRLGLAEQLRGRNGGRVGAFSFDRASAMAEQLEAAGNEPLDFSCTIMVLGKSGVGKSATINSIFDEVKFGTDAFQTGTKKVQDVVGTVHGIKVRVIDTPGLLPSWSDQHKNGKILNSVKQFIKKTPPDIVLYLDRLDVQSRDFGDMPLLRTITEVFGPAIWFNAIVVLTHAASAPPDGPNGTASSYDMFVTQRSHAVQHAIRQAAGDMRLMNPVSLVENHSACRTNRAGQRVLPNGQVWKPHLLLLSFASKILAEANTLLKLQDTPPGKPFASRSRTPPLPFLLSSLLQSRPQVKLPEEQFDNEDGLEDDSDDSSDEEDEAEYDELPPFKCLTKAQIASLTKAQQKAYYDELEYREKLIMRKQLKEEKKRRRMMKRMAAEAKDLPNEYSESTEVESGGAASVPVPMPDLALPASFDSDNPTHRYRCLDSSNQWVVRAVLDNPGWDHDVGYEGINVERLFVVKDKIPISFSGQITKDKKDATVQMELASSLKHGEGKATSLGFDMQTVGKDLAYTLRSETRFSNCRRNKAAAGVSCTLIGDALSAGVKVEDKLIANKRFQVVMAGGLMAGRGDIAYGGSLEAQLKDKDYPLGRSSSTLGISVMDWHGDLAIGCNLQSQLPIGRHTNLIARGNLNNRGAGQVSLRINSSEQLQIALIGMIPLLKKLLGYPQQMQF